MSQKICVIVFAWLMRAGTVAVALLVQQTNHQPSNRLFDPTGPHRCIRAEKTSHTEVVNRTRMSLQPPSCITTAHLLGPIGSNSLLLNGN
ncbi:hypothetical protein PF003_g38075 [Phytophthora fragariae]|nr:hypothetical protein PF003_g38075 [Phytophthora fragariae]